MYTKDGTFLKAIVEREDWVWTVAARPKQKFLAVGCNDGSIAMLQTVFSVVHGFMLGISRLMIYRVVSRPLCSSRYYD